MSPTPGRSTLITSAPNHARSCVHVGPDWTCVKSRMRTPSSALAIVSLPLVLFAAGNLVIAGLPPIAHCSSAVAGRNARSQHCGWKVEFQEEAAIAHELHAEQHAGLDHDGFARLQKERCFEGRGG